VLTALSVCVTAKAVPPAIAMAPGISHFQNVPANIAPVVAAATALRRLRLAGGADQENWSI
jgi:hypothetical protein